MDKELENLAKSLATTGFDAKEIWNIASQRLTREELEKLWGIPRQNIANFVLSCFHNLDLKSPFLDIGCGKRSYKPEAIKELGHGILYIALDHYLPNDKTVPIKLPNLLADTSCLPFVPSSINTVVCTEVLEHVNDDHLALEEISRVLKKEGILISTLPCRDIPKHEKLPYQIDYRRYAPEQVESLLKTHGFNILFLESKFLFTDLEINILALAQKE